MQIDIEKINRLPPDVSDRFKKLLFKYKEESNKELAKMIFYLLQNRCGLILLKVNITKQLQINLMKLATGEIKRLIVNMPPRHTKSEFASTLLPAWMIGKNPKLKIIQTTHRRTSS